MCEKTVTFVPYDQITETGSNEWSNRTGMAKYVWHKDRDYVYDE
jgi:hypothetical protein